MESGLVRLVVALLSRMHALIGGDMDQLVEYVVNNASAWTFPEIANEKPEDREQALADWEEHIAILDTAILSLIGENDIPDDGIEAALDDILQSSLWQRRLLRRNEQVQQVLKAGLVSRSRRIWNQSTPAQRRGYFLAGIGLATGHALDAIATDANLLLVQANAGILENDPEATITAVTSIAERVFAFHPFTPNPMPATCDFRGGSGVGYASVYRGGTRLSPTLGDGGYPRSCGRKRRHHRHHTARRLRASLSRSCR
jgi:hypothetical protein